MPKSKATPFPLLKRLATSYTYNAEDFASLPWKWHELIQHKIVQPLFYYAKDNYVNGKPEVLEDWQVSVITLPNLKAIPKNELSVKNIHTGNAPDLQKFVQMLREAETWYDEKIDQVYAGIRMLRKRPEDFGGKDIRPRKVVSMNNRKLVIAALERELRKEAFGANKFQDFVSKFSDLAVKSGDSFLLKFSDKLISYPDFMRESDPVEFSQHFVRNVKPQGSAYRDSLSSESTARSILDKVVRKLEQLQGKFATQASDFFRQASNAIRLP